MNLPISRTFLVFGFCTTLVAMTAIQSLSADDVSFNRDIRPILATQCFVCHGPDEENREADLRLDIRSDAIDSGAIEPSSADDSELINRIFSEDPDEQMPPPDSSETLTDDQKQLLRDWIAQGATYEKHWAFVPPKQNPPPKVKQEQWIRGDIDRFVLGRMEASQLAPSPNADRFTLVRRLYLDLIGLPPTIEQADAFVYDNDPKAYEKLVDRLLASKHYGERWARQWLDLARYSDTNGYEKDRHRSIWAYRDWVINALNDDMPFDQFTIEQLAGDMLPNATASQKIATGFHRNTMLNEEGGIDPLEYRFYAMVDRIATTGTVWLGMTTGCAQCHTHKYDPISHGDYYRLMALLNNADEPDLRVPDPAIEKRQKEIEAQIQTMETDLLAKSSEKQFATWIASKRQSAIAWNVMRPIDMKTNLPKLEVLEDGSILSSGDITKRDVYELRFQLSDLKKPVLALRLEAQPDDRLPAGGPGRAYYEGRKGDFFLSDVIAEFNGKVIKFNSASHSFGNISIGSGKADATNVIDGKGSTGWSTSGREGKPSQLVLNFAEPLTEAGELKIQMIFERHFAASLGRFRWSVTHSEKAKAEQIPAAIEKLLAGDTDAWSVEQRHLVKRYFVLASQANADFKQNIDALRKQMPKFKTTMVMLERPSDNVRKTYRHHRGEYISPREAVSPGIPAIFDELTARQPTNRLELAQWLVSKENPLVARVTVNRAWRTFFGDGLMRTSGDFGTQSEPPTHPELLDWLAVEFMEQGWSLKKLHKLIVTSATYQQAYRSDPKQKERDPLNLFLARGPRVRVDAEMVRDIMLQASGKLSKKMFGPSVFPPQPASVTALAYGGTGWIPSKGEDRFRRSIYTYNKRTAPFAAYAAFDGPTGETCIARRNRSCTPLQALTLLNDEMFLELARAAAENVQPTNQQTANHLFRKFVTRPPEQEELDAILNYHQAQLDRLNKGELSAMEIGGRKEADANYAAWVMVARALMNLDESIIK